MGIHRRKFLMLGTVSLCGGLPTIAWSDDLYNAYLNSTSKQPFIAFLGRQGSKSTIGHAFIGLGVRLNDSLIVYERFYGLYPKDGALADVKSVFTPASGKLDATWDDIIWDVDLNRKIDASEKAKVLAQFEKWKGDAPQYSLLANGGVNCNSMVGDVARIIGLKVPSGSGSTRPWKFIEALKSAN